jgi:O-antigen ligase
MQQRKHNDSTSLFVELGFLFGTAPVFLFAARFPGWLLVCAFAALIGVWIWRKMRLGVFFAATPIDIPLFFLFALLLPLSIWVSPTTLRIPVSVPRALVLFWSFCLLATVTTYASRRYASFLLLTVLFILSGVALALVSLFGTQWLIKFEGMELLYSRLPSPLVGLFSGAETGFHPNQVAGTLLYVLPMLIALAATSIYRRDRWVTSHTRRLMWIVWPSVLLIGATLFLTQSRSALLGVAVSIVFMVFVGNKWGRILLLGVLVLVIAAIPFVSSQALDLISDAPQLEAVGGSQSVEGFRVQLWTQAIQAMSDFPITGMGLGTFRHVVRLLYPLNIPPSYDIGHAHNFFIQTALDFGILGLVAVLAIYIVVVVQLVDLWRSGGKREDDSGERCMPWGAYRIWAVGFGGCIVAQSVYSTLDAVAMGAKTSFMFWYLVALVIGVTNLAVDKRGDPV